MKRLLCFMIVASMLLSFGIFSVSAREYSYDEMASKVNLSSSSTRVIFFRMKNELKQKLERGENSE